MIAQSVDKLMGCRCGVNWGNGFITNQTLMNIYKVNARPHRSLLIPTNIPSQGPALRAPNYGEGAACQGAELCVLSPAGRLQFERRLHLLPDHHVQVLDQPAGARPPHLLPRGHLSHHLLQRPGALRRPGPELWIPHCLAWMVQRGELQGQSHAQEFGSLLSPLHCRLAFWNHSSRDSDPKLRKLYFLSSSFCPGKMSALERTVQNITERCVPCVLMGSVQAGLPSNLG